MYSASGSSTPGLSLLLAKIATASFAFGHGQTVGSIQQETIFSELNLVQGSTASRYLSPSLPLCIRSGQPLQLMVPNRLAAMLDTEPVASSYSGGVLTR